MLETIMIAAWIGAALGCAVMWIYHARHRRWARQLLEVKCTAQIYREGRQVPRQLWDAIAPYERD